MFPLALTSLPPLTDYNDLQIKMHEWVQAAAQERLQASATNRESWVAVEDSHNDGGAPSLLRAPSHLSLDDEESEGECEGGATKLTVAAAKATTKVPLAFVFALALCVCCL